MKTDQIKEGYIRREEAPRFDDTPLTDGWQLATYIFAKGLYSLYNLSCVVDVGCGSAYKLTKLFHDTIIGIEDNPDTLEWLLFHRRQAGIWLTPEQYDEFLLHPDVADSEDSDGVLMICSDVIEHVADPAAFFDTLVRWPWAHMIIGTPARELGNEPEGPPGNVHHCREWEMSEFRTFLEQWSEHFHIRNHCIINPDQRTQVAWLERKSSTEAELESPSGETGDSTSDSFSSSLVSSGDTAAHD